MPTLKLTSIDDDKPVRIALECPASLHRDLIAYGEAMGRTSGGHPVEPQKLIVPMLQRFIASDRGFSSSRKGGR